MIKLRTGQHLRCGVGDGRQHRSGRGQPDVIEGPGDAEITQQGALVCARRAREQEVGGLDVAMDHAAGVGVVKALATSPTMCTARCGVMVPLRWAASASVPSTNCMAIHNWPSAVCPRW